MSFRDHIKYFPFLDMEQFCLVSHSLHLDYIKATLGDQRRSFKVDIHRNFTAEGCPYDWVSILKHLDVHISGETSEIIDLTKSIENMGWYGEEGSGDIRMDVNAEHEDHEALFPVLARNVFTTPLPSAASPFTVLITPPMISPSVGSSPMKMPSTITLPLSSPPTNNGPTPGGLAQTSRLEILYEIHLHPTYRVPTLWFSLIHLPEGEEPFNIDTIYKYLVPEHDFKKIRVSGSGVHISLAQHPITNAPAWFVHPCGTPQSLEPYKDDARVHNYLRLWLGLVGPSVGLTLPLGMVPLEE